jgi:hypothetical protein
MKPFEQAAIPDADIQQSASELLRLWRAGKAGTAVPALDEQSARAYIQAGFADIKQNETVWVNDKYQVHKRVMEPLDGSKLPPLVHLSIRRLDRSPIRDWRDMQEIKNLLVGPENEAAELYPAESRRVDTANQFHLWVLADPALRFPFGFTDRMVSDDINFGKSRQRPL